MQNNHADLISLHATPESCSVFHFSCADTYLFVDRMIERITLLETMLYTIKVTKRNKSTPEENISKSTMKGGNDTLCFNTLLGIVSDRLHNKLTEFHKEDSRGGDGAIAVGGHTLEIAGVGGVQVANAQSRAVRSLFVGNTPCLWSHWCIILQPAHGGWRVSRHMAVQLSSLAQGRGDVVHGSIKFEEVVCKKITDRDE